MKNPTSINLRITRKNDYTDDEGDSAGEFDDYDGNADVDNEDEDDDIGGEDTKIM